MTRYRYTFCAIPLKRIHLTSLLLVLRHSLNRSVIMFEYLGILGTRFRSYYSSCIYDPTSLFASKAEARAFRLFFELLLYHWVNGRSASQLHELFHCESTP